LGGAEAERQDLRLADADELVLDGVAVCDPVVRDPPVQLVDRRAQLGPGPVRAEAPVDPRGKCDMAIVGAPDIRRERLVECRRIEVR